MLTAFLHLLPILQRGVAGRARIVRETSYADVEGGGSSIARNAASSPLSLDQHPGRVLVRFKSVEPTPCCSTHSTSSVGFVRTDPRFHTLRYQGVLPGHSNDRAEVVPYPDDDAGRLG